MIYKIVSAAFMKDLADRVNEEIAQGWIPLGGVTADDELLMQAMVNAGNTALVVPCSITFTATQNPQQPVKPILVQ